MDNLRKVIENEENAKIQRSNGISVYPAEEVVGDIKKVKAFAAFYSAHRKELEIIKAHFLLQYCENVTFTPAELGAYRMGLDIFIEFFKSSCSDIESYMLEAEQVNQRKSIG